MFRIDKLKLWHTPGRQGPPTAILCLYISSVEPSRTRVQTWSILTPYTDCGQIGTTNPLLLPHVIQGATDIPSSFINLNIGQPSIVRREFKWVRRHKLSMT